MPSTSSVQCGPGPGLPEGPILPDVPGGGRVEGVAVVDSDLLARLYGAPGQEAGHGPQDGVPHRVELGRPGLAPGVVTLVAQGGAVMDDGLHGAVYTVGHGGGHSPS